MNQLILVMASLSLFCLSGLTLAENLEKKAQIAIQKNSVQIEKSLPRKIVAIASFSKFNQPKFYNLFSKDKDIYFTSYPKNSLDLIYKLNKEQEEEKKKEEISYWLEKTKSYQNPDLIIFAPKNKDKWRILQGDSLTQNVKLAKKTSEKFNYRSFKEFYAKIAGYDAIVIDHNEDKILALVLVPKIKKNFQASIIKNSYEKAVVLPAQKSVDGLLQVTSIDSSSGVAEFEIIFRKSKSKIQIGTKLFIQKR